MEAKTYTQVAKELMHGYGDDWPVGADVLVHLMEHWEHLNRNCAISGNDLSSVIHNDLEELVNAIRSIADDGTARYEMETAVRGVPPRRTVLVTVEMECDFDTPDEDIAEDIQTRLDLIDPEEKEKAAVRWVQDEDVARDPEETVTVVAYNESPGNILMGAVRCEGDEDLDWVAILRHIEPTVPDDPELDTQMDSISFHPSRLRHVRDLHGGVLEKEAD